MAGSIDDRPIVRCLVAFVRPDGRPLGKPSVASLGAAYLAMCEGYTIIGPDPEDEMALAEWHREREPFNSPRIE